MIYKPNHPKAYRNGCVYEHIVEAEKMIGRYLFDGEVVHHEDRNRTNNNHENLKVFRSDVDHILYHCGSQIRKEDGVYVADRATYHQKNTCPMCGSRKCGNAKLCVNCYKKVLKDKYPSRAELEKWVLSCNSFVKIGKHYGVTDNAVRKWCKKYGLPFRRKDIISYIGTKNGA